MAAREIAHAGEVPDRGPALVAMLGVLTGLAFLAVVVRFMFRARRKRLGWADWFMGATMVCFVGWSVTLVFYANRGGCQHIWDVEKRGVENLTRVILLNWTAQVFGILGVAAGKISIAAFLLAVVREAGHDWQRVYLWTVPIGLASGVAISCSILTFAQCTPMERLWDPRVEGTCMSPKIMAAGGVFTGSFNTAVDASLAIIPATIFWTLNMDALRRVQLSLVFGLNMLTSVCSGIKTQYLVELANRTDQTWATYDIFAWVTAELFLIIVCGTVPMLYPLLVALRSCASAAKRRVCPGAAHAEHQLDELVTIGRIRWEQPRKDVTSLVSYDDDDLVDPDDWSRHDSLLDDQGNAYPIVIQVR